MSREEKFRALVKSHLRIILEDHTEFPVLLYEWRFDCFWFC
jgi:hypothetical protein